jgi:TolB protein
MRLAYASRQEDSNWDIYIYDLITDTTTRMTYNLAFEARPKWSPDDAYLVYESYQADTHLDLFVMRSDPNANEGPTRLAASSDSADFSPAWSPDLRHIAFVSWREGNQDIYIFSLDTQETYNLTRTPNRHEDYPAWSPDGQFLAFSAVEAGVETVFVQDVDNPNAQAVAFRRGRTPVWSPSGGDISSIAFAVDASDSTFLTVAPYGESGVATEVIQAASGATMPVWTSAPLPPALVNSGGVDLAIAEPLYNEQVNASGGDPPYGLGTLINISGVEPAYLSDRVNDSFNALRERVNEVTGIDFLGTLSDALWDLDHRPQPGEPNQNWHRTGRAFSFNRNLIAGFPPPIEVVREDTDLQTFWRVYVRVADEAQTGQLGEPLRRMPWDFQSRDRGDVEAYEQGGRLRDEIPPGYYVDLTQIAEDYQWIRVPAGPDWRDNFNARNFWTFQKRDGLTWYGAMREIYAESELGGWVPTATPEGDG